MSHKEVTVAEVWQRMPLLVVHLSACAFDSD